MSKFFSKVRNSNAGATGTEVSLITAIGGVIVITFFSYATPTAASVTSQLAAAISPATVMASAK